MLDRVFAVALALAWLITGARGAAAQEMYIGQIIAVAFGWCPVGTEQANGQAVPVQAYQALYSLIGNAYGGSSTMFNLPDLTGRAPVGVTSSRSSGSAFAQPLATQYGVTTVDTTTKQGLISKVNVIVSGQGTLSGGFSTSGLQATLPPQTVNSSGSFTLAPENLPAHTHPLMATAAPASTNQPSNAALGAFPAGGKLYVPAATAGALNQTLAAGTVGNNTTVPPTAVTVPVTVELPGQTVSVSSAGSGARATLSMNAPLQSTGPVQVPVQSPALAVTYCIVTTSGIYPPRP